MLPASFTKQRRWLALTILLLTWLFVPTHQSVAAPSAQAGFANWYSLDYIPSALRGANFTPTAIALDTSGNGWIAAQPDSKNTVLYPLHDGRMQASAFSYPNLYVSAIGLSSDGSMGWAIGSSTLNTPDQIGTILHYAGGKWGFAEELAGRNTDQPPVVLALQYELVLDHSASKGWAIGLDSNHADQPALLHLVDGKWDDASSLLPTGVSFSHIAADPDLKNIWAAGYDRNNNGDAALYYLKDGKWQSVSQPVGHYVIDGLAVAASGNGWAILGPSAEPAISPQPTGLLRLRPDGSWTLVKSDTVATEGIFFAAITLDANGNGWAMGHIGPVGNFAPPTAILRLVGDKIIDWQSVRNGNLIGNQRYTIFGQPSSLAIGANGDAWAITYEGYLLRYGNLNFPMPALAPITAFPFDAKRQDFATGYTLRGPFLDYWNKHGGLRQFGLPITPELIEKLEDGKEYIIQYTERARFEYHADNKNPYKVQLGLLGSRLAEGRQNEPPFQRTPAMANPAATYFGETGHNLMPPLGDYWKKYGGLAVFGYPISEAFNEESPTDGKIYLVQYFERNRLEYHPQNKDPQYQVLLGLLGSQQYARVYGTPPPFIPNPPPLPPTAP
jgi:hypothetical protein